MKTSKQTLVGLQGNMAGGEAETFLLHILLLFVELQSNHKVTQKSRKPMDSMIPKFVSFFKTFKTAFNHQRNFSSLYYNK